MSTPSVILRPQAEPATLTEAKAFIQYTDTDQDPLFTELIKSARIEVEQRLGVDLISRRYEWWVDSGDAVSPVWLPRRPVLSVESVTSYDDDNNATTEAASTYRLTSAHATPRLVAVGGGWSVSRREAALKVVFQSGHLVKTTASGAGTTATALTLTNAVAAPWLVGLDVTDGTFTTTVSAADGSTGITLAAAQSWSDGATITIGFLPERLKTYTLQVFAQLVRNRLPQLILPPGQHVISDDEMAMRYGYNVLN